MKHTLLIESKFPILSEQLLNFSTFRINRVSQRIVCINNHLLMAVSSAQIGQLTIHRQETFAQFVKYHPATPDDASVPL